MEKKEINHATIKVSWIKEPDYSHSIRDLEPHPGQKTGDFGWACGASSGYVAMLREKPDEIYMIGHDLYSQNNKVNNLYKGTKHYVFGRWSKSGKAKADGGADRRATEGRREQDGPRGGTPVSRTRNPIY